MEGKTKASITKLFFPAIHERRAYSAHPSSPPSIFFFAGQNQLWIHPGARRTRVRCIISAMRAYSALLGPFYFNWSAFWLAVALYFVTGVGMTLSYHRNLSHRSFKLPRWLEYSFAYCAVLSLQGSPIEWVSIHRVHHQYTDTWDDPHSPIKGFWYSHIGWVVDYRVRAANTQWYYRFLHRTYPFHSVALGILLYAAGGLPYIVWGIGVRTVCFLHATCSVGSICHMWGKQVWNTGDLSRNNRVLGLLAHGEGWHNNHHAFEYSARQGLEWWEIDTTWYVIRFLEAIGLATDVKLPSEAHKKRKAFPAEARKKPIY